MSLRKKIKDVFQKINLYDNNIETAIKVTAFIFSWIVIKPGEKNSEQNVYISYIVFFISLLMEFLPQLNKKNEKTERLFHGVFCFSNIIAVTISMGLCVRIYEGNIENILKVILNIISIFIMLYMFFSLALSLMFRTKENNNVEEPPEKTPSLDEEDKKAVEKFNESLMSGPMGNIVSGGGKNNE